MNKNTNPSSPRRTYFPNLDGLRFIGSLIIIILHQEDIKLKHGITTNHFLTYYLPLGNIDVSLFFVLSGFLITYLLLKEKKESGSINLKKYYTRRTLRIWPLYYFILLLGFFILPYLDRFYYNSYSSNIYAHFWVYFLGYALFLCPFVKILPGPPQTIGPIWSVAVEELFYLCWPLFLKKTRRYVALFVIIILVVLFLRNGLFLSASIFHLKELYGTILAYLRSILIQYRISCMAIGAIGAYLFVFEKNKILSFLYRKDIQWTVYILTFLLLGFKIGARPIVREHFPSFSYEIYSFLFAIIILNLATNPGSVITLNYKWMTYLGKVSYGLYMYHPIMRIFSLELTEHIFRAELSGFLMNLCFYSFTLLFTIIISVLSYTFFEKKLIGLGKRINQKSRS